MSDERAVGLGNAGPRPSIIFEDKTYVFGMLTERVMAKVSMAVWDRDGEPLYAARPHMDPAEYQKRLDEHIEKKRRGDYLFENDRVMEYVGTTEGTILVVSLLIGAEADVVTRMMQAVPQEVTRLMNEVAATSVPLPEGYNPKRQARSLLTQKLRVKAGRKGRK